MSHPINDEVKEELGLGLHAIISAYHNMREYILADRERLEFLDKEDIIFLNGISKAVRRYNPYGKSSGHQEHKGRSTAIIDRPAA